MRARVAISFAVALASVVGVLSGPAGAVPLMTIQGTVSDPLGRGIQGAEVSDGRSHATSTDASGHYQIEESSLGTYVVTVTKIGVNPASKTVGPAEALSPVDFSLTFIVVGTLSTTAISTAVGPASATVTLTNSAPNPGEPGEAGGASCVYVTDSRTGVTAPATYSSTDPSTGASTWTYALSFEQGTAEGAYQVSFLAKDCSAGTVLSTTGSRTYVVDNTAPAIEAVLPADGGNTVFPDGQPLLAVINDGGGSGVLSSGVGFTLTDETESPPRTTSHSGSSVSYNPATRWAKTSPVVLTVGHVYRIGVAVQDRAGNVASVAQRPADEGGGFLATSITLSGGVHGSIPSTACEVSTSVNPASGMRDATCRDVPLLLIGGTGTFAGSRHAGKGGIRSTVSLAGAVFTTTVAGIRLPPVGAARPGDPNWSAKTAVVPFRVGGSESSQALEPAPITHELATLTGEVPAAWTSASLSMEPTLAVAGSQACADPSTQSACTPDPIGGPWSTWDPPIAAAHVAACDTAVSHKEAVALSPGDDALLVVAIDTARLDVQAIVLHYSLNLGPAQEIAAAGTGAGTYSLSVPGADLPQGTQLDYAFEVTGSFLDPQCASRETAVAPRFGGFESLATSVRSLRDKDLFRVVGDAILMAGSQPGYSVENSPEEICEAFFVSPSPCALAAATDSPQSTVPQQGPYDDPHNLHFWTVAPGAPCPTGYTRRATYTLLNTNLTQVYYGNAEPDVVSHGFFDTAWTDHFIGMGYNAVLGESFAGGSFWPGNPVAISYGRIGYTLRAVQDGGPSASGYALQFNIVMNWRLKGHFHDSASQIFFPFSSLVGESQGLSQVKVDLGFRNLGLTDDIEYGQPDGTLQVGFDETQVCSASAFIPICNIENDVPRSGMATGAVEYNNFVLPVGTTYYYFYARLMTKAAASFSPTWGALGHMNVNDGGNMWQLEAPQITLTAVGNAYCIMKGS